MRSVTNPPIKTSDSSNSPGNSSPVDKWLLAFAVATLGATACTAPDDEYKTALPENAQVTVPVPTATGQTTASTSDDPAGPLQQGLLGQIAEDYQLTRDISLTVNTSALALLDLLRDIVAYPATSRTDSSRTWGPYTPGGLDPLTYRVTVTRDAGSDDTYTFSIDIRPKASSDDADFLSVLDGALTKGATAHTGKGGMNLNFDNRRKYLTDACEEGAIHYVFDNTQPTASLDVVFSQFANSNPLNAQCLRETPHDGTYHYDGTSDGAGDFSFSVPSVNIAKPTEAALLADLTIRSRWLATGEGRSDVKVAGATVQKELHDNNFSETFVSASQCWDTSYATVYETSDPQALKLIVTAGDPQKCVFSSQSLPQ